MRVLIGVLALAGIVPGVAAHAAEPAAANPLVTAVVACKSQGDDTARLRCYDASVGAMSQAAASGAIVVVDREAVRKTRRSLFGFSVPKLPFFGGDDSQNDTTDEIEAKIKSVRSLGHGKWAFELESGGRWQTTASNMRPPDPKAGETIKIKRGLMGNYFLSVEGRKSITGMRVG